MPFIRSCFVVALLVTVIMAANRLNAQPPDRDRPNILLILVDDLGKEWLSCYGSESIRTPVLDDLAAGGMLFNNAYSMAQCTPTRVTLLTGQYPWRHGWVNHWDVPRWGSGCHFDPRHNTTFARLLRQAGYATAIAGKWQINDFRVQPGILVDHGFDDYCVWTGYETGNEASEKRYWDPYLHTKEGSKTYPGKFGEDICADFLIDFMGRHKADPMLMYYPMILAHGPVTTTPLEPGSRTLLDKHRAMVRYIDYIVGRLLKAMDDLGIRRKTIVMFTTDNGTAAGLPARRNGREVNGGKANLIESGVCAPFIVNWPGMVPSGTVTDALTDFTDIFPTLAELARAPMPANLVVDGHSVADVILGKKKDSGREWILAMGHGPAQIKKGHVVPEKGFADRVVRDKRYKLWVRDRSGRQLIDLATDPSEIMNLIDSKEVEVTAARERLEKVIKIMPGTDAAPRYDPIPPQPWDTQPAKETAMGKRPNILLLLSDDQRFDTIHALNNPAIKTPHLDRLARHGIAFTHAYTMGAMHGALCVPSRAMLMTGRTLFHLGEKGQGFNIPLQDITLPEWLQRAGYVTYATGKWHNDRPSFNRCFNQGGALFFGGMADHLRVPVYDYDPTGKYAQGHEYMTGKFSSELFSDYAVRFLKEYKGDRPFFLYVAYTAPHDPRMPPKKYLDKYPFHKIELPKNFMPVHPFDNGELHVRDEELAPFPRTPEVIREHIAAYYAMISHLDDQIGRVLDALEDSDHAGNTIVIFAGDNGLALGQHGLMGKQSVYDHSVHVPLIMSGPGLPRGETRDGLCYLLDVFPTLCDMLGMSAPDTVDGVSLAPHIKDKEAKTRDSLLLVYREFQRALRTDHWKLIRYNVNGRQTTQLFDADNDPWEINNLVDDPAQADRLRIMNGRMRDWMSRTGDVCDWAGQ